MSGDFSYLRRDPVAGFDAKRDERVGRLRRSVEQTFICQACRVGCLQGELVEPWATRRNEVEKIGGERFRHEISSIWQFRATPLARPLLKLYPAALEEAIPPRRVDDVVSFGNSSSLRV